MLRCIRSSGLVALSLVSGAGLFARQARADSLYSYNVVVTGTYTDSSHVQGRTFVNNLVTNNQPDFAQSTSAGTGDTLDVAGSVTGSGLTIERGVFRHASAVPSSNFTLNLNGGSTSVTDSSTSIANLASQMSSTASYYSSLSSTAVTPSSGNIAFNATGSGLNVFSVSAANLQLQNESISVNANSASGVIIEVLGSSFNFGNSEHVSTSNDSQVIWYFPDATTIQLNDPWEGSILAPNATLSAPNQNINGGVYVQNFTQTGEVHLPIPSSLPSVNPSVVSTPLPASAIAGAMLLGVQGFFYRRRLA